MAGVRSAVAPENLTLQLAQASQQLRLRVEPALILRNHDRTRAITADHERVTPLRRPTDVHVEPRMMDVHHLLHHVFPSSNAARTTHAVDSSRHGAGREVVKGWTNSPTVRPRPLRPEAVRLCSGPHLGCEPWHHSPSVVARVTSRVGWAKTPLPQRGDSTALPSNRRPSNTAGARRGRSSAMPRCGHCVCGYAFLVGTDPSRSHSRQAARQHLRLCDR